MPVMCYHSIDPDWESPLAVDPADFAQQCSWLSRHRRVLPASRLVRLLGEGRRPPARATALTFDDGFADFHEHGLAILRQHRLPAAMFLVARNLEEGGPTRADWLRPQPDPGPRTLSREQVLEIADLGIELGSHSWAHHDLRNLSEDECTRDLRDSRESLEDLLRRPVTMLAYPYGFHAPHVRRAAETAGYEYALSLPEGPEPTGRFAVPRAGIYRRNSVQALRTKSSRWYLPARLSRAYPAARQTVRRLTPSR